MPPLSNKFGDVYPMRAYEGDCVVSPAVNGLHNDINREAENVAAKEGVSPVLSCYLSSRVSTCCFSYPVSVCHWEIESVSVLCLL